MAFILVADDDESVRKAVKRVLLTKAHEVAEASDGASALAHCRKQLPDLVLIDMYMPGQDGIETIRALRKEASAVRVVAMSGGGKAVNIDVLEIALQLGAVGILRKPFEVQEVLDVVAAALASGD